MTCAAASEPAAGQGLPNAAILPVRLAASQHRVCPSFTMLEQRSCLGTQHVHPMPGLQEFPLQAAVLPCPGLIMPPAC